MGLYDRDYIKEEYDSPAQSRRFAAWQILIGINAVVWVAWVIARDKGSAPGALFALMDKHFMVSMDAVRQGYIHTLVTSTFSHIDLNHILFNMLGVWIFGKMVEERYGFRNTLGIYLIGGTVASLAHCLSAFLGPYAQIGPALGASGSVMAFAVIAAMLHPRAIFLFMFIIPMQLWLLVTIYIISDIAGVIGGSNGTANFAHLGGVLAGFLIQHFSLLPFNADRNETFVLFQRFRRLFRPKPKLEVVVRKPLDDYPEEVLAASRKKPALQTIGNEFPEAKAQVDSQTASRVDAILEKISKEGMNALTPEEKSFLEESSRKYKR